MAVTGLHSTSLSARFCGQESRGFHGFFKARQEPIYGGTAHSQSVSLLKTPFVRVKQDARSIPSFRG